MTDEQRAREIDAAVAEHVMGWKPRVVSDQPFSDETFTVYDGPNRAWVPDSGPRFSTTWEGMGLVVEKMAERGFDFELRTFTEGAVAAFRYYEKPLDDLPDGRASVDPREGGAPLAVCLAALKAKGVDVAALTGGG